MANHTIREKKGPLSSYTMPGTKVANRTEIFDDDDQSAELSNTASEADSRKLNLLMQQLMGGTEDDTNDDPVEEEASSTTNDQQEEEFTFQLFSSKPVAKVNISEKDNEAERLAELIATAAQQRSVDHDMETDADFIAQINEAAVSFDDIMTQSQWAYPALRLPHRVIPAAGSSSSSSSTTIEKSKEKQQRRKSKKRRDFEKAVREGRIVVAPNMQNPETPGGWPGWPGNRTRYAIITNIEKDLKVSKKAGNTSFKRGGGSGGRGAARGGRGSGRGGMMRGRGRGR